MFWCEVTLYFIIPYIKNLTVLIYIFQVLDSMDEQREAMPTMIPGLARVGEAVLPILPNESGSSNEVRKRLIKF